MKHQTKPLHSLIPALAVLALFLLVPFSARGGDQGSSIVIDDKSPIVPAPSESGWFGGVEATFLQMSRADGMR